MISTLPRSSSLHAFNPFTRILMDPIRQIRAFSRTRHAGVEGAGLLV